MQSDALKETFVFVSERGELGKYFTSSLVHKDGHEAIVHWPLELAQKRASVLEVRIPDLKLYRRTEPSLGR